MQEERRQRAREQTLDESIDTADLGPEQEGLLIAHYGTQTDVEDHQGKLHRCLLRQHLGSLVAGDHVVFRVGSSGTGVINAVHPRQSVLGRPDRQGNIKAIAANIDQMLIVVASIPELRTSLIDSYLVAAETLKLSPILIFNKTDLLSKDERQRYETQLTQYENIGYVVLYTDAMTPHGIDPLLKTLPQKTSVLVGQSGVGKSSIISKILPEEDIKIGELSELAEKGKHTTTMSRLYHLEDDANLIDSPGIREFGLWNMPAKEVAQGFVEFKAFISQCKFRDCEHLQEPDCALKEAVEQKKVSAERFENYHKLISS